MKSAGADSIRFAPLALSSPVVSSVEVDPHESGQWCEHSADWERGSTTARDTERHGHRGERTEDTARGGPTYRLLLDQQSCESHVDRLMYCFHESAPDSRPPPVSFSPPNDPLFAVSVHWSSIISPRSLLRPSPPPPPRWWLLLRLPALVQAASSVDGIGWTNGQRDGMK